MAISGEQGLHSGERHFPFPTWMEVLGLVIWESLLVLLFISFSAATGEANTMIGLPSSLLANFSGRDIFFFHSLALPLAAVLVLVTVSIFGVAGRRLDAIKYSATAGAAIASGTMLYILFTGETTVAYAVMIVGMVLEGGAAAVLFLSLWPHRDPSASMRLLGFDLSRLAMWVVMAISLVVVAAGSYAALGDRLWSAIPVVAGSPGLAAAHESLIIACVGAAVVVLVVKWFGADRYVGATGLLVKLGLYGVLIGTPAMAIATFVVASTATQSSGELTVLGSIPMEASVFVMCAVMVKEAGRLRARGPLGMIRESLTFGLLFLLYWVNVAVTLPSLYVDADYSRFSAQYLAIAYMNAFAIGHEHALVVLTAMLLFMLVALMFGVTGVVGALAGWALIAGYVLSTTANVFFIFNAASGGSQYVAYIGDGLGLMLIGVIIALVGMLMAGVRRLIHAKSTPVLGGMGPMSPSREPGRRSSYAFKALAVAVALCLCLIPVGVTLNLASRSAPPTPSPYMALTSGNWNDLSAAWSPDGSMISFVSDRNGPWELFVEAFGGSSNRQLTPSSVAVSSPSWSRDSSSIAFLARNGTDDDVDVVSVLNYTVSTMEVGGSASLRGPIRWSPDDSHLLFFMESNATQLVVLDTDTKATNVVATVDGEYASADWISASQVVFSTFSQGQYLIFSTDIASGLSQQVLGGEANFTSPIAAPGGSRIAYISDLIPTGALYQFYPYPYAPGDFNLWVIGPNGSTSIFQSAPMGSSAAPFTPGSISPGQSVTWSPDGTTIAYVAYNPNTGSCIYLWDVLDGRSTVKPVGPINANATQPSWSADGTSLVFSAQENGFYHVFILDVSSPIPQMPNYGLG